jgi:cytochrome c-type biogenesis protein CcmH
MIQWLVFALMTGFAVFAVLGPLAWRKAAATRAQSDIAVYKDQLAEIDRDLERGLIASAEAEAARVEVSRRLLEADAALSREAESSGATMRTRFAALIGLIAVPAIALGVYLQLGSPDLPDAPLAGRMGAPAEKASIDELVARVEAHLERSPEDGEGWDVIAPVYLRAGRNEDARKAFGNAIRLLGSSPTREAFLGEAILASANGVVTSEARAAFERALKLEPTQPKALYYLGLALEQDGDAKGAAAAWEKLAGAVPADSPMGAFLRREIERVGGQAPTAPAATDGAPGPTAEDIAAAQSMSQSERGDMIKGMVARLAERLSQDGGGLEDWQKLIRAYVVLGEKDKALAAAADARKALAADPAALKSLEDVIKSLGLEG